MSTFQNRKYSRFSSLNLLSYSCLDENDQVVSQSMGRTLNISKGGLLLETHIPIDPQYQIAITLGLDEELVTINGKVAYCRAG